MMAVIPDPRPFVSAFACSLALALFAGAARAEFHEAVLDAVLALPVSTPVVTEAYGTDPHAFGELRLPAGAGPFAVAVVVHGGCWTDGFTTLASMAPLADALGQVGIATWNIEYRQLGDPGAEWPGMFLDWAHGTDHVRDLAKRYPLDLTRTMAIGHSAGGTAALWIAGRTTLPESSEIRGGDPLPIKAVVDLEGPVDVRTRIASDVRICGRPAVVPLFGGQPDDVPSHYAQGNPIQMVPLTASTAVLSSFLVPYAQADAYRAAAAAKGQVVEALYLTDTGHFKFLNPTLEAGKVIVGLIKQVLGTVK